jgi:hypothetical protein
VITLVDVKTDDHGGSGWTISGRLDRRRQNGRFRRISFNTGNQQTFRLPIEDGIAVIQGLEAFVWVNERSRARPWGNGLTMRGTVTSSPTGGRMSTVTIHINQRLPVGFGMNALRNLPSDAARDLYQCIQPRRHLRFGDCRQANATYWMRYFGSSC